MRTMLTLSALLLSTAAASQSNPQVTPNVLRKPMAGETATASQKVCRDRIVVAREARGLRRLEGETPAIAKPMGIYAVDKRVGGCSMLVMHGNINDIRPLPQSTGEARMMPAR